MDLNSIAFTIEQNVVGNEFGWGQSISYTKRRTNVTTSDIKAFCQDGHFNQQRERDNATTIGDDMSFLSVFLSEKPERGDKISFAGSTWYVDEFTGQNPYDIFCVANARHKSTRSGRKQI